MSENTSNPTNVSKQNNTTKLSKHERKVARKHHKKTLNLLKEYGSDIFLSEDPTRYLFIGNGGLLCGMNRKDLLLLFGRFGPISKLVMLPKKSFCFLFYKTIQSAEQAVTALDGHIMHVTTDASSPLYLKFVKRPVDTITLPDDVEYPTEGKQGFVKDLIMEENFVDKDYELELIKYFQMEPEDNDDECSMKNRKVKHFGYEFLYGSNNIDRSKPLSEKIPDLCRPLIEKMLHAGYIDFVPDQLTVNQYEPGQGIPAHVDTHSAFEDGIISLTLHSQVTMEFLHPEGNVTPIILPRRSLLVLKGESRYLLSHRITPRKFDVVYVRDDDCDDESVVHLTVKERSRRISLTFRKILHKPCTCKYARKCDSQSTKPKMTRTNLQVPNTSSEASNLEGEHVYKVYEEIADHFSGTRHSPWPKVKDFLCGLPAGSVVADVGCGNGKYLGVNPQLLTLGSDRSFNLVKICDERKFQVIVADCLHVPYRSGIFDASICIAVIHHLSTSERRLHALRELVRITRVDGLILVYVWALEQNLDEDIASLCDSQSGSKPDIINNENVTEVSWKGVEHTPEIETLLGSRIAENNLYRDVLNTNELESEKIEATMVEKEESSISGKTISHLRVNDLDAIANEYNSKMNKSESIGREQVKDVSIELSEGRNVFQQQDLLVPWHLKDDNKRDKTEKEQGDKIFHRFYHVFKRGELEELCSRLCNVSIKHLYYDRGNWCVVLKKL